MKKMTKVISLALALVMCLALCACGQKDSGDTAADGKRTFIMGVDPEYPPFSWATTASTPALTWRSLRPPAICSDGTCRSLV